MYRKKCVFFLMGIFYLPGVWLHAQEARVPKTPPNIIVFIADDLGWEDSNPYGNPVVKTPNLQKLANEGMRFDNFFLTASSCSPSRSSMFSGLYPHNTGAMNLHQDMSPAVLLFPELLREAGYYTMCIGKSHGTNNPKVQKKFDKMTLIDWSKPWTMIDLWLTALNERPKDKPFFLWAASIDPHYPYNQGETPYKHKPKEVILPPYYPDIPEIRTELASYYDEIDRFDLHVGRTLEELKKQGVLDNTLIIIVSDNGKPFPQCKTRLNMQGLKSPFIVWNPSLVQKGQVSQSLVSAVDIAPTILDVAGIARPTVMQGKSIVPILKNPTVEVRQYAFGEHNWHSLMAFERVAITKDFIYIKNWLPEMQSLIPGEIYNYPSFQKMQALWDKGELKKEYSDCFIAPRPAEELFDKKQDNQCMHNLAAKKKYRDTLARMQLALQLWQQETSDVFPGKDKLMQDKVDRRTGADLKK